MGAAAAGAKPRHVRPSAARRPVRRGVANFAQLRHLPAMDYIALGAQFQADPRFRAAAYDRARRMLDCYASNPRLCRHLADLGQAFILGVCYSLHPRITAAEVWRRVPPDMASRSRVNAQLLMLERLGAIVPGPEGTDRRARVRMFSPEFRALADRWIEALILPALPYLERVPADIDDPAARPRWFANWLAAHSVGNRAAAYLPNVRRLLQRRAGFVVMLEFDRRNHAPEGTIASRFSKREIAMRYGLPRTHVIDLVDTMWAMGWLREGPLGPEPTPAMREETERCDGLMLCTAARVLTGDLALDFLEARAIREARAARQSGEAQLSLVG